MLSKGLEIEIYTGTSQGEIVGLSDRITQDLPGFVREPDSRNVEYVTSPRYCYDRLLCDILKPRRNLRSYLTQIGDYTLVPGSTLSLGDSDRFYRSDPSNPYHSYIEQTYHTNVVTASIHINIGISDVEELMRACRLIRLEAPLFLALSASSPFLDGEATGYHSTRWGVFPKTPTHVPIFTSHAHFVQWTEEQLALGTMQNVRHLWSSVRPNGDNRPYDLNRLELRICDLIVDPIALLSVVALLEARITQLLHDPSLEPLTMSKFSPEELITLTDANEDAVARNSLNAQLHHWQDGQPITAREWIKDIYQQTWGISHQKGFGCFLSPIKKIINQGNTAQQWLQAYENGYEMESILSQAIQTMIRQEQELEVNLCQPVVA